jgi:hypothetical protein
MLLGHHGVDPTLSLGRDHVDGAVERRALEPLGTEDLADLLTLAFRGELDMPSSMRTCAYPSISALVPE